MPTQGSSSDTQFLLSRIGELERRLEEQGAELRSMRATPPAPASEPEPQQVSDRRGFVRAAAAAATGALVAGAASLTESSPATAADGNPIVIGSSVNTGTQATGMAVSGDQAAYGFGVTDNGVNSVPGFPALLGHAKQVNFFTAILGVAEGSAVGVDGRSTNGTGVVGQSVNGQGVVGSSQAGAGVTGLSNGTFGGAFRGSQAAVHLLSFGTPPPTRTNPHLPGEIELDTTYDLWYCVAPGSPGTWRKLAGAGTAGALHVLPSTIRVYDSRPGETPTGVTKGTLNTDQERVVDCTLGGAIPAGATAAYVNITIVSQSPLGFLAAFKNGIPYPGNSTLNWDHAGQVVANSAVVALDDTANFRVRARNPVHYLVDVIGYYR